MSVFGPNQVGELILGNAVAADATVADFLTTATDKEIKAYSSNGAAVALGAAFKVLQKTGANAPLNYEFSDIIDADSVKSVTLAEFDAETAKSVSVTGTALTAPIANATTEVFIRLIDDGGSLSAENFRFIYGSYVSGATAPTANVLINGIVANLQASADASNPGEFVVTNVADTSITIAGVIQAGGNAAKGFGGPVQFTVQVAQKSNGNDPATALPTIYDTIAVADVTQAYSGIGTSKWVEGFEWFSKGYKYEAYRDTGYPANFNTPYYVNGASEYNLIHISYYKERSATNVEKQHKTLTVAIERADLAGNAVTNAFLADLRIVLGAAAVPSDLAVI